MKRYFRRLVCLLCGDEFPAHGRDWQDVVCPCGSVEYDEVEQ